MKELLVYKILNNWINWYIKNLLTKKNKQTSSNYKKWWIDKRTIDQWNMDQWKYINMWMIKYMKNHKHKWTHE